MSFSNRRFFGTPGISYIFSYESPNLFVSYIDILLEMNYYGFLLYNICRSPAFL